MSVLQIVRFKTTPDAIAAINARFQREVAPKLPGLQRREAGVTPDGEWLLVLRYDTAEAAKAAMGADTSDVSGKLMAMIDKSTLKVEFVDLRSE